MLSYKVLQDVLKLKTTVKEIHINPNMDILYRTKKQKPYYYMDGFISIYELEQKCHEWALRKGHTIIIDRLNKNKTFLIVRDNRHLVYVQSKTYKREKSYNIVFDACEFIWRKEGF